jgi:magnesium transporter
MTIAPPESRLKQSLDEVTRLLDRHRVLEALTHRQEGPKRDLLESLQHRQNLVELHKRLRTMHPADVAFVLEALPPEDRATVWDQIPADRAGLVFLEVSSVVRGWLIERTEHQALVTLLTTLDPEDLGYISEEVPPEVLQEASRTLESRDRHAFEATIRYDESQIGHHMTHECVVVPETHTIEQALNDLRSRGELPRQTDRLFVVDTRNVLRGSVTLPALLLTDPSAPIVASMQTDIETFGVLDQVQEAAGAFERYDLVSAPVIDDRGKLVGRLTVDAVMDVVRSQADLRALKQAGLSRDEDLFASPMDSAFNRWPWLGINLVTAFLASSVIGQFENSIRDLAALAALMPIVASIGGNTGNQTMAIMVRALAGDQVRGSGAMRLLNKELVVALLNGSIWGVVVGLAAVAIYANYALGAVMTGAVVLNLVVAAVAGVSIPLALHSTGRDPAYGSSVLLTFITDAMGFFLFLGLASVFLL